MQLVDVRVDILVDDAVLLGLKAIDNILLVQQAQIMTYMKLPNMRLGLLINFNSSILKNGIKRVVL